ncbi:hypothetical protein [Moraxella lacunata]
MVKYARFFDRNCHDNHACLYHIHPHQNTHKIFYGWLDFSNRSYQPCR